MKTSVTRNSRHYLLAKTTLSNLRLKTIPNWGGAASSRVDKIYISAHLNSWYRLFRRWNNHAFQGSPCGGEMVMQKSKGGILQTYDICQKRYTYKIFMFNYPLPKQYLSKRMFSLNARVVEFFDTVEGKHHQCTMDYLYNSDTFFKAAYNHEKNYWLVVLRVK